MGKLFGGIAWVELLSSKKARREFVRDHVTTHLAYQIRTMRNALKMNQSELSKKAGITQAMVSRLEDESNGAVTIKTLFKIADAFDCAVQISLVPFSRILISMSDTRPEKLIAKSYRQDKETIIKVCDGTYENVYVAGQSPSLLYAQAQLSRISSQRDDQAIICQSYNKSIQFEKYYNIFRA